MNKIFHGIDLVDQSRMDKLQQRHGDRFMRRVFTEREQEYCRRYRLQAERLAGRFAVKEAVMKMLGTGWQGGIAWTDIETVNDKLGRPEIRLNGKTQQLARELGIEQICVSITHTKGLALASVVGLGRQSE